MNRTDSGFSLVELLVVMIIAATLASIALPSFLSQASKAKEVEAKQTIGAMNRASQAYYSERSYFTDDISNLGLGINPQSANYSYSLQLSDEPMGAKSIAEPSNPQTLRAYVGGVQPILTAQDEVTTTSAICQSERPAKASPDAVQFSSEAEATGVVCGEGYEGL